VSENYPIRYKVFPKQIDKGSHWITIKLENIGDATIRNLEIELNSKDTSTLTVSEPYRWLGDLKPLEEEILPFKVEATRASNIYVTINALMEDQYFHWESPDIPIDVGLEVAEIRNLFILSKPYTELEETLEAEVVIKAKQESDNIILHFWLEDPYGALEEIGRFRIEDISHGEERRYKVEFTPHDKGKYKVSGYLYHEDGHACRLIDKEEDSTII
jgi:hypothetical protein